MCLNFVTSEPYKKFLTMKVFQTTVLPSKTRQGRREGEFLRFQETPFGSSREPTIQNYACIAIINKNTLGIKKVRGQSEAALQIGMCDQKL